MNTSNPEAFSAADEGQLLKEERGVQLRRFTQAGVERFEIRWDGRLEVFEDGVEAEGFYDAFFA